ncbi:MAG: flagellar motor protein MotB, partial [Moraxellaceae bacterium]
MENTIMKNRMSFTAMSGILGLAITAITSATAIAQNTNQLDSNWYIGANVGQARAEIDNERIAASLLGAGYNRVFIEDDDRDTGFKLFGGYQLNRYFSLEGGYFDLGEFGFEATVFPTGTLEGNIKLKGVNLDLVGFLPFTEKFSAFGRVGVNYAQAKDSF